MPAPSIALPHALQPVVELRELRDHSWAYGVRAPRAHGVIPPISHREDGFASLTDCLADVARGLGSNFARVYVRLNSVCVGERDLPELRAAPAAVALVLQAAHDERVWRPRAETELLIQPLLPPPPPAWAPDPEFDVALNLAAPSGHASASAFQSDAHGTR